MAYSGTVSETVFNTGRVITAALRRCKLTAQQITSEHVQIAKDALYMLLSRMANQGVPLWCVDYQLLPLYEGQGAVTLPLGTVDILNVNLRTLTEQTGTNTDTSTSHTVQFTASTAITCVGVFWSGASTGVTIARSDDGVAWTTIQTEADPGLTAGEVSWFDLDSAVAATYFRVSATTGVLNFTSIYLGNNPSETPFGRLNRDQYAALSNRYFTSNRPLQYWFDRQIPQPIMRLNPVPNAQAAAAYSIALWSQRQIMDVGTLTQDLNIPQRWYLAIVCELARQVAREIVEVDVKLIPQLDADAAVEMKQAWDEERDNSPQMIAPNIAIYTA